MSDQIKNQQTKAEKWFRELRNQMVGSIQKLDGSEFIEKEWQRPGGGGGLMSLLKGEIFEKVGVNISTVHGNFSEEFKKSMPGTEEDPSFWASGISVVAHMNLYPAFLASSIKSPTSKSSPNISIYLLNPF
jgi:coproporphyrinogen III oxidase